MPARSESIRVDPPRGEDALEARREQVASLHVRGYSIRQIAAALTRSTGVSVHRSSVQRDVAAIKVQFRSVLVDKAEDIYAGGAAEIEEVRRELWRNYARIQPPPVAEGAKDDNAGLRLAYLQAILGVSERRVRFGQSLGIVVQAPQRIEVLDELERTLADMAQRDPEAERVLRRIAQP